MTTNDAVQQLFDQHSKEWLTQIQLIKERILANLVMVSQIPAKTFTEGNRAAFILERFIDYGVEDALMDKKGNVHGIIKGKKSKKKVLMSAHMDTLFPNHLDHNVSITQDKAEGIGIADNALGVSFLISLPEILKQCKIEFDFDIILLATVASKEKGDLSGMRYFLQKTMHHIDFNLNIEGITIGQIDHSSLSRVRADITVNLDNNFDSSWRSLGNVSAIMMLSDIMDCLFSIPLPRKPKTVLNVGKIEGGNSYSRICTTASMQLEVRSESDEITEKLIDEIRDNCHDIGAKYGVEIEVNFFSRNHVAGIKHSHPLVKAASTLVKNFGQKTKMGPSNSEIAVPLTYEIPSITLGITTGKEDKEDSKSFVNLHLIPEGIAQIILLMTSIDKGYCDD